jgi:DNA-binding GntR family transcriptional regulator
VNMNLDVELLSLEDRVQRKIREAIISGKFKPGMQLKQISLANELGVSQRTVREALNQLTAEGFVIKESYKGYRTISPSINTQRELYEIRIALEGIAIENAAEKITAEDLLRMRQLLPLTGASRETQITSTVRDANREFHWIVIRSSGLQHVIRILAQVWDLILTYYHLEQFSNGLRVEVSQEDLLAHEQLIQALEERDGQKAKEINTTHLRKTLTSLESRLNQQD